MPTSQRAARAAAAARAEVLRMLKDDHRKAEMAFQAFERLDPVDDADAAEALVRRTCAELTLHVVLEEELFYPSIRPVMRTPQRVDLAEIEHASAKTLIANLAQLTPDDRFCATTFRVLGEYVQRHAMEEETDIFPQLAHVKLDWEALRDAMTLRRESLQQEMLPQTQEMGGAGARAGGAADPRRRRAQDDERQVAAQSAASEDA